MVKDQESCSSRADWHSSGTAVSTNQLLHQFFSCLCAQFAQIIRGHWGIENRLHWVKDVVFKEDSLPLKHHNAASNWSLLRSIVINLARQHGYDSLTKAERFLSHNIPQLFSLLQ
jgi:predicted transposase YbfD/YdcC